MKISISSYSFSRLIADGSLTQLSCILKAKELGFDAIEFVDILAPEGVAKEDYAKALLNECKKVGLPISCFTFGADFLNGSDRNILSEIQKVKENIDLAEILGVNTIRHDATTGDGRPFDTILPIIAEACRQITEYAAVKGIKTTVENHGFFCQDSDRVEKLYKAVNHPNFGLLADMGNFLCVDEASDKAFDRIARYAFYVHSKDFHTLPGETPNIGNGYFQTRNGNYLLGTIIGHGDVPIKKCLSALKKVNYNGYIAIEFEGPEEPLEAISIGLTNLKNMISNTNINL